MTIHVGCATDGIYAPHCAAMLHSVLAHVGDEQVTVHLVHGPELSAPMRRDLRVTVEQGGAAIEFHEIAPEKVEGLQLGPHHTSATWYRVFLFEALGTDVDRLLWLDVDVVVLDDLRPLAGIDLAGAYVAGVDDLLARNHDHLELLGIAPSAGYFNAGVLVFDVDAIRRDDKDAELVRETRRLAPWLFYRDQDALNVVLGARRLSLHPRWNVTYVVLSGLANLLFDEASIGEARERPAVRHFLGHQKPWWEGEPASYADAYWQHRRATPFAG